MWTNAFKSGEISGDVEEYKKISYDLRKSIKYIKIQYRVQSGIAFQRLHFETRGKDYKP
jgi:hypothetical protein